MGFGRRIYGRIICYVCNEEGHRAVACPRRLNRSDGRCITFVNNDNESKRIKGNYDFMTLEGLKNKYGGLLKDNTNEIEYCPIEKCKIETIEGKIVQKKGVTMPQALEEKAFKYIDDLLRRKIIRRSESQWRNPIRFIEKENGEVRMVLNLILLNNLVRKEYYEAKTVRDVVRSTNGSSWFTVIDLKEAFYSIEIEEKDKEKTCFELKGRIYEFNSMVMGYKNAPMILQRVMMKILNDYVGRGVEIYLDDIVIHAKTREEHDKLVLKIIDKLLYYKLRINMNKIQFALNEVSLLGFKINGNDILPLDKKKEKALGWPKPTKIKDCRQFLGIINGFRSFIKKFAEKTFWMYSSLKIKNSNDWRWSTKMETEFNEIKEEIKNLSGLGNINYNKEIILRTDASNIGLGAVLLQKNEVTGELRPIEWGSKKLTPTESRYSISEKEMYAVYYGMMRFEYELRGRKFVLETDHKALEEIRNKPFFGNNRINNWIEKIMDFDFEVRYIKGEKMGKADELSRGIDGDDPHRSQKSEEIKQRKWNKHVFEKDGCEYWKFDGGEVRKIPIVEERKSLCKRYHEELLHRGYEPVYYEMKKEFYWPGIRKTICNVIKECEICEINNRKNKEPPEYVTSTEPLEKVALDLLHLAEESCYVLIGIDYFTRFISAKVIYDKKGLSVVAALEEWFKDGYIPKEIISDNGREFCNSDVRECLNRYGIEHRKVSVESHRSNGRVERAIRTLRDYVHKVKDDNIETKIEKIILKYNRTYHSAIKRTPMDALEEYIDEDLSMLNVFGRKFKKVGKRKNSGKFVKGQKVRIAQHDNVSKYEKGRFIKKGIIVEVCEGNAYIVKIDDTGKLTKKRASDLKSIVCENGELAAGGGMLDPI